MVAPFTDHRDGDAKNLIYLVLSGFTTRPTLPASLLISVHIASVVGRLLAIAKISSAYPPCLTPVLMTKGLLIFPTTITLAWAPSSDFTSRSTFLGIPKLASYSSSFYAVKSFFKNQ